MKSVAIVQSNYIPWKGYFDLIARVDELVLYDDVQYTRRDWRNRNRIKTAQGVAWLTVPIQVRGRYHQRIDEALVSDPGWAKRHWQTLAHAYGAAPYFYDYRDVFASLYEECSKEQRLSVINRRFIEVVCGVLGLKTAIRWSSEYDASGSKTRRLLAICRQAEANEYVTGPAARTYLDEACFANAGIEVVWMDYSGYREYAQLHPPFDHQVTVLDLIFNTGTDALRYMKAASLVA